MNMSHRNKAQLTGKKDKSPLGEYPKNPNFLRVANYMLAERKIIDTQGVSSDLGLEPETLVRYMGILKNAGFVSQEGGVNKEYYLINTARPELERLIPRGRFYVD
jgi:hypothetical protein